jgi:hypothetical protein
MSMSAKLGFQGEGAAGLSKSSAKKGARKSAVI